jgi:hypothetical protein
MSNGVNTNPIFGTPSMSWTNGTEEGPVFNYIINGVSIAGAAIPAASTTTSGIITTEEQTFSGNKIFSDNLTIHSMNVNSNSVYSTTSETYSLGTETSFFSNEYINTLNIGQAGNYIALKKVDENINTVSSIYLPNITEDSMLLYAKKDI